MQTEIIASGTINTDGSVVCARGIREPIENVAGIAGQYRIRADGSAGGWSRNDCTVTVSPATVYTGSAASGNESTALAAAVGGLYESPEDPTVDILYVQTARAGLLYHPPLSEPVLATTFVAADQSFSFVVVRSVP